MSDKNDRIIPFSKLKGKGEGPANSSRVRRESAYDRLTRRIGQLDDAFALQSTRTGDTDCLRPVRYVVAAIQDLLRELKIAIDSIEPENTRRLLELTELYGQAQSNADELASLLDEALSPDSHRSRRAPMAKVYRAETELDESLQELANAFKVIPIGKRAPRETLEQSATFNY